MASDMRERPYRTRTPPREISKGDTASTALTAQVIICILLMTAALIMKKTNAAEFSRIHDQYQYMLSESSRSELVDNWLLKREGFFKGFLDSLNGYISGIFPKKEEAISEPIQDIDEPADEIYEFPQAGSDSDSDAPALAEYNYLSSSGEFRYMGANGALLSPVYIGAGVKPPITGLITSGFSYRYHPMTGESDFHTGIDIASPEGTDIHAVLPGTVTEVGESEIYGKYIVLQHAKDLKTSYSHCSRIIAEEGMAVRQGERIALVGETGVTTGPHLHFSVIADDQFVDPAWILKDYINPVQ